MKGHDTRRVLPVANSVSNPHMNSKRKIQNKPGFASMVQSLFCFVQAAELLSGRFGCAQPGLRLRNQHQYNDDNARNQMGKPYIG